MKMGLRSRCATTPLFSPDVEAIFTAEALTLRSMAETQQAYPRCLYSSVPTGHTNQPEVPAKRRCASRNFHSSLDRKSPETRSAGQYLEYFRGGSSGAQSIA